MAALPVDRAGRAALLRPARSEKAKHCCSRHEREWDNRGCRPPRLLICTSVRRRSRDCCIAWESGRLRRRLSEAALRAGGGERLCIRLAQQEPHSVSRECRGRYILHSSPHLGSPAAAKVKLALPAGPSSAWGGPPSAQMGGSGSCADSVDSFASVASRTDSDFLRLRMSTECTSENRPPGPLLRRRHHPHLPVTQAMWPLARPSLTFFWVDAIILLRVCCGRCRSRPAASCQRGRP